MQKPLLNAGLETTQIFEDYARLLQQYHCTLKDNCLRTWIYVQGIDTHYAAMAKARAECFDKEGLTAETHYIASTGIEGRHFDPRSLVLMDAYAVKGIAPEQIRYLHAPTHLNPTNEYGVTFERGTAVDYGDRRHIFISGTASINNKGKIAHPADVKKQMVQTMENIQTLLAEAEAEVSDVCQMIVYLRDTADYQVASDYFDQHYEKIPKVIVLAPVCRSGWLIEVECIAAKAINNDKFKKF
jgi:enamine deaminase RidA (YjgF/YER057c/UK114 family)